jgi:hypothetical protein
MNRNGQIIVPPRFDDERDFFQGLAAVQIGEHWGFVNEEGNIAIAPQFDDAHDFSDDRAPIRIGRKWGYIDLYGNIAIEPRFQAAGEFREGLAKITIWEKAICGNGIEVERDAAPLYLFQPEDNLYDSVDCSVKDVHNGFIDKTGTLVISARFEIASDFSEGLASAVLNFHSNPKYGYINHSGEWEIPPRFNVAHTFSEGLAVVETKGRLEGKQIVDQAWGFIDRTGVLKIPAIYQFAGNFSEGLASVEVQSGKNNYIDRDGRMVIKPRFDEAWEFSDGFAKTCIDEKCRFVSRGGDYSIRNFRGIWPFSDGLAVVDENDKRQNYIDTSGKIIAGYNYDKK